jgi:transposase InsO family protein
MSGDVKPENDGEGMPPERDQKPVEGGFGSPPIDTPQQDNGRPSGFLRSEPTDGVPKKRKKRETKGNEERSRFFTPAERLNLLDIWQRSGLGAPEFADLVGVNKHSLYGWKAKFEKEGPAGLEDKPRGGDSKLSELTRRTILMIKKAHPEYGCERISYLLVRGPALAASPATVAKVLHDAGYVLSEEPTHKHGDMVRRFERASPNQLWQTDLFTFILKRQTTRVYLVGFMDDHSRFIVGYGLHASQSTALTLEVMRAAIASYGRPEEVLTDNGSQYVTWRGTSAFTKECQKRGIKQIVSAPKHPQTLGKIERFWGTLWRECLESAVFQDLADARRRIGLFIDHYNFQRPHSSLGGLVPADRFFGAAAEIKKTLEARVAANALDLALHGVPRKPFYLTGQVDGKPFSIHSEGARLILSKPGTREEIELASGPNVDLGRRILEAVSRLGTGSARAVGLTDLRKVFPDVSRADFDAAVLELWRQKLVSLEPPHDVNLLAAADRDALINHADLGSAFFVGLPKGVEVGLPLAVCPDGSPTPGATEDEEEPEESVDESLPLVEPTFDDDDDDQELAGEVVS